MQRYNYSVLLYLIILLAFSATALFPCTTFIIKDDSNLVFGRNLDWFVEEGLVIANQRGIVKQALIFPPEKPAEWVSKYGSVTFNQVGREMPYGGINEAGLVVENMVLMSSQYPQADERPAINEVQWIQYMLDNYATVKELIEGAKLIRIGQASTKLHYLICDKNGDGAIIEYIDGKLIIHSGDNLPIQVLTNSQYKSSVDFNKQFDSKTQNFSLYRFGKAAQMVSEYKKREPADIIDYSFGILNSVCSKKKALHPTKWRIVYDIGNMKIYFRTSKHPEIKHIDISKFDFSCEQPYRVLNMAIEQAGDATEDFIDYTTEQNQQLILKTFDVFKKQGFLDMSDSLLIMLAKYPEGMICK